MSLKFSALFVALLVVCTDLHAGSTRIQGRVKDSRTGENIIGATVYIKENPLSGTASGLDGSFSLESDVTPCTLVCTYVGYKQFECAAGSSVNFDIALEADAIAMDDVVVVASNSGHSEAGARTIERQAMNVVNVMSARAIELSPDITVANVIQRMSGVTVERNASGEGQYAILRGMDKRYNYTLINGVKIPSPDNKNRFVPLDIFPSEMLERIEVTKSLTADMEGDGIGGAVNLVMKDAPRDRQLTANLSTGYSALYLDRDFQTFDWRRSCRLSPYEVQGRPEDYAVTMDDFTTRNLRVRSSRPLPDLTAGISYGDRFFRDRLGLMVSGSYQNLRRGKDSNLSYQPGTSHNGTEYRLYSELQSRLGTHAKLDYCIDSANKLAWYNGYMDLRSVQVRDAHDDKEGAVRMKWNRQYIVNSTLRGEHRLLDGGALQIRWSAVCSRARSLTPDNTEIYLQGLHVASSHAAVRRWEHNSDRDLAGYLDISYALPLADGSRFDFSLGGMYRDKRRESFFNEYTFDSATGTGDVQVEGEDWTNYDEILFEVRPYGNIGDPLNYDASERIAAGYVMVKYTRPRLEVIAGFRAEHTDQGYTLRFPRDVDPRGRQRYTSPLPDVHLKYVVHNHANLRLSYARAINRPSFFEIVPYSLIDEDYNERGNPDLKHTVADNLDLRYEFFPRSSEQFMVGLFYKRLENPIEYGLLNEGQDTYYMPMNFGDATNLGVEVDVARYFNWFGIKANYTYTHSQITTDKRIMSGSEVTSVKQTRPLFGQAAHVANLSLLFKDAHRGWEGQIAGGYTGKRLSDISNWFDDDIWEDGFFTLDVSFEKSFRCGLSIYAKASNLLDTPLVRYIQKGPHTDNIGADVERVDGHVLERREWHGQSVMVGLRFRL